MKAANLFEATATLQQAKNLVLGDEHESDRAAYKLHPNLDVILLEHDMPEREIFPNKENAKPVTSRVKGNTTIQEVERMIDA